jgi:hypothetical protein
VRVQAIVVSAIAALVLVSAAPAASAAEISVVSPANKETVHSNQGKLTVRLRRLDAPRGAGIRLLLDGAAQPKLYHSDVIELDGIPRGSHSLQAVLIGADGERLAASAPVSFYMWHASRLFPEHK